MGRFLVALLLMVQSVGGIEFKFSELGPRWSKVPTPGENRQPDGTLILETYLQNDGPLALIRLSKPMHPDGYEATFQVHARAAQQMANDPDIPASGKPRDVELRKIGDEYLMTLVNPVPPGYCQVLFSVYRPSGVEQCLVETPLEFERVAFVMAKELVGLPKLEEIPEIPLPEIIAETPSKEYSQGYEQGRKYFQPVLVAFGVIVGGVLITFLVKRKNQPEEQCASSYVSMDRITPSRSEETPDSDSSDS